MADPLGLKRWAVGDWITPLCPVPCGPGFGSIGHGHVAEFVDDEQGWAGDESGPEPPSGRGASQARRPVLQSGELLVVVMSGSVIALPVQLNWMRMFTHRQQRLPSLQMNRSCTVTT